MDEFTGDDFKVVIRDSEEEGIQIPVVNEE